MLCQNRANQLRALFDAQLSAVQRHIVRLNLAPFLAGVEAIIGASALILILQPLLRSLGRSPYSSTMRFARKAMSA